MWFVNFKSKGWKNESISKGQASEIMELMDDTDAVLVAGGDGTLMEAVTGLLRRKDINLVSRSLPLGIKHKEAFSTLVECLYKWHTFISRIFLKIGWITVSAE